MLEPRLNEQGQLLQPQPLRSCVPFLKAVFDQVTLLLQIMVQQNIKNPADMPTLNDLIAEMPREFEEANHLIVVCESLTQLRTLQKLADAGLGRWFLTP